MERPTDILSRLSPRRIVVPVLIGLSVVAFMFWRSYKPGDLAPLAQAHWGWLLVTFAVLAARDAGYIYRIRHLTHRALSWRQSLDVIMIWELASCVMPSAVGGTTVATFIIGKEGVPLGKSLAYVMVTAMLDNLYYVVLVPVVILFAGDSLYPHEAVPGGFITTLKVFFGVSYVLVLFYSALMLYGLFVNPVAVRRLIVRVFSIKWLRKRRNWAYLQGHEMVLASEVLRGSGGAYWARAILSTAFVWTARYLVINTLIAAFAPLTTAEHGTVFARNLIYKVVLLVAITPGGAGFAEGAFPTFFKRFIGTDTMVSFIVFLYRIVTFYLYLVLGSYFLPRWIARVMGRGATPPTTTTPEVAR